MPVDKLTIEQFAQKVKAKYPQYKDVNDSVLVEKMVNKYPEYKEKINYAPASEVTASKSESFKPMTNWLNIASSIAPENIVDDHTTKVNQAKELVSSHLSDIDGSITNLIHDRKKDLQNRVISEQLGLNPKELGPSNPQAQELQSKLKQTIPVSSEEVQSFKDRMNADMGTTRMALNQKAKDLSIKNPEAAKQLKAAVYRLDRQNDTQKDDVISKNEEKLKNGDYDYDINHGVLTKPVSFFGGIVEGFKQKNKAFNDYDLYSKGTEDDIIKDLNNKIKVDPDKPTVVGTEGFANVLPGGEAGMMIGGQPIKPLAAGALAGWIGGPNAGAASAALVSGPEMYKLGYAQSLPQNYAAIKQQNPDISDKDAYHKAAELADKQASVDAATGIAMGALGGEFAFKPTGIGADLLKKSIGKALTQLGEAGAKKGLEGLGVGTIGAAGQVVKNIMAQGARLPTETTEGVTDQLKNGVTMTLGMTIAAKAPELLNSKTYNQLFQGLSKQPQPAIDATLEGLQKSGHITPEEAQQVQTGIKQHQELDQSIKPSVPESDRLKVQGLIKKRNELEASLESSDKAYHADIKEEIKNINEQIVNISKGGERGELQKLVDTEHKNGNIEGFATDPLRNASENDLKKYFKEISEQVHSGNEEAAKQTFGENIVNKAKELYPQELDVNSLFDGTKSTKEIVSSLKNQVNDEFLNDQIDKLVPYLEANPEIKFSKMFSIGRGEAHLTGDWTALLSHVKDKKQLVETIVHELYHSISVNKLLNDSEFDASIGKIRESIIDKLGLSEYLKDAKNTDFGFTKDKKYYGLLDNKEFIAELFSNKEFNKLLDGVKVEEKNTMLDRVVNVIRKALGIKDLSFTEKIKKTILDGIDHKIEFEKDPTIKQVIENLKEAHRPEDFVFGEKELPNAEAIPESVNKSKISVIQPGEIKQPETITIKPKENALPIEISNAVDVPETSRNGEEVGSGNAQSEIIAGSQEGQPQEKSNVTGQEGVESPELKQMATLSVGDAYGLPFIDEPSDKRTGIKNIISKTTRFERRLPPVEVDKLGSDQEILLQGKDLVDNNVINPGAVVNRILDTKEGMQPDEAKAMQYYMHQLGQQDTALREKLATATNETESAEINGQLQQLSDEIDAATQANIISGKAWSDVGNIRQIVSDNGFNASRDLATIKDAYGGNVPKDVQAKLDRAFKERDEALNKLAKLQADEKNKATDETIKKQGAPKNTKKTKEQFKSERTEIKQSISDKLKQARSGESGLTAVPLPFAKELIAITPEVYKLIKSYAEEGIQKTEEVINRLHDVLKDEIDGIQKSDIVNLLAGKYKDQERQLSPISQRMRDYRTEASLWAKIAEATKMEEDTPKKKQEKNEKLMMLRDRLNEIKTRNKETMKSIKDILTTDEQKEIKRLNRQRKALETKYKNKAYLLPKEEAKTPFSEEILKEKQRIVNANYKIRIEKRKAFESQKSMYQKALMWVGRGVRLSVLSGYNVLGKLASAATIGGGVKRIPEQAIGFIYGNAFKGIAEKAPIEGFVNAAAEAKFYKEFLNPKTFAQNTWEILKSGESPLSKKFSPGTYEHIPGLYLPTDLHQVIKDPLKRATYEASLKNALAWAERNGMDINDDLVIQSLETAAYKRAQYEIFQEQNWLSKKFGEWKHSMEESGNIGATGKFLADFMIPVSTVPTNIARRMVSTSPFGLIKGAADVVGAYRKGIESLTPEQADSVMRQLKQGTLGTALWLIGWYGYSQFGGLYSKFNPNKQRDQGELMSDEMSVGGKMIPKPVQHALPLEIIQFAATARRVYDNYKDKKSASTLEAIEKAGLASIGALTEQIPVIETVAHTIGAFNNPYEAKKLEEDARRRFEPQILRETGIIGKEKGGSGGGAGATGHLSNTQKKVTKTKHISHKHN